MEGDIGHFPLLHTLHSFSCSVRPQTLNSFLQQKTPSLGIHTHNTKYCYHHNRHHVRSPFRLHRLRCQDPRRVVPRLSLESQRHRPRVSRHQGRRRASSPDQARGCRGGLLRQRAVRQVCLSIMFLRSSLYQSLRSLFPLSYHVYPTSSDPSPTPLPLKSLYTPLSSLRLANNHSS